MTDSSNKMNAPMGGDPGKTGDLSPVAQAVAARAASKVAGKADATKNVAAQVSTPPSAAEAYANAKDMSPLARLRAKAKKPARDTVPAAVILPPKRASRQGTEKKTEKKQVVDGSKPTRRSARGSEVEKREKDERDASRGATVSASGRPHVRRGPGKQGDKSTSEKSRVVLPGRRSGKGAARDRSKASSHVQQDVMKYAADNRAVRGFYTLTTGPQRHLFWLAVAAFVAICIYLPVRDFYISQRTVAILTEQKTIRDKYNDSIGKEVEGLLSQEGIEDAARKDFGMVMPGEKTIDVQGLDEDGNPVVVDTSKDGEGSGGEDDGEEPTGGEEPEDAHGAENAGSEGPQVDPTDARGAASKEDSGKLKGEDATDKSKTGTGANEPEAGEDPKTSAEVEAAERAVLENSPWYLKVLDALFLFDGVNGMAVVSTGE